MSRKRFHGSDGSDEYESFEPNSESNDSIEMSKKRKKKFRKGGKKLRRSESKGAASIVLSEKESERNSDIGDFEPEKESERASDIGDFEPKLRTTEKKSVRFHQSSEFLDKKTKEYKKEERQKKQTEAKHTPNTDTDDSTDDDSDPENIILIKSMRNVIVRTEDGSKMVKILVEDEHFWNNYNCYAYERNGGVVIRFYTLQQ